MARECPFKYNYGKGHAYGQASTNALHDLSLLKIVRLMYCKDFTMQDNVKNEHTSTRYVYSPNQISPLYIVFNGIRVPMLFLILS